MPKPTGAEGRVLCGQGLAKEKQECMLGSDMYAGLSCFDHRVDPTNPIMFSSRFYFIPLNPANTCDVPTRCLVLEL